MRIRTLVASSLLLLLCAGCKAVAPSAKDRQTGANDQGIIAVAMIEGEMMTEYQDDWVLPAGGAHKMAVDFQLSNGTKVKMDGTVIMPDGKTIQLRSGDALMMDGTVRQGSYLELITLP